MANKVEWRDSYSIGVDVIDKEHQQLFKIINKLFAFREEEKDGRWVCQEGIKFFKGHALKHFASEEQYMESINYPEAEQHKKIHKSFRDNTLPALEEELENTQYAPDSVEHFLGVCTGWLIGHTLTEDMAISGKSDRKWDSRLQEDESEAVRKVIVELVFNMFRLESQLLSDTYGGEKFGDGLYFRLIYGTKKDKKKLQVFLVLEEKILINTIGKMLGIQTNKVDTTLLHAARYTARQFANRIMEYFPKTAGYELKEENLLSYEQFQKVFERENMQVSMLFNTGGAGYFAYCMVAPHLLEEENVVTPIGAENAISEVEEYLKKKEEEKKEDKVNHKPKVLVVDDSKTIRCYICDLLKTDYDVTPAESGIAAIRAITLNKPDLVLLDYEMPVCDGRQTLQMLRSDSNFADLPVIFLTGRGDPDSVRKVLSLKPTGYLLKNLKPEAIKDEVDNFFQNRKA
ncbi:MAG: bacteriohemerythrin [Lachnospiraceae bacterium]|nr:bacteriohemerythrin [Lachnospiraceae bacterium]